MNERGFTLVELLVAMISASLLMIGLSWSVSRFASELKRPAASEQAFANARATETLDALLSAALPLAATDGADFQTDHIRMRITPPVALGAMGEVMLDVGIERQRDGLAIVARFAPAGIGELPEFASEKVVLARNLRAAAFSFGEPQDSKHNSLPRSIKLDMTSLAGTDLSVTALPRIDSDGACRFDPISQACRL